MQGILFVLIVFALQSRLVDSSLVERTKHIFTPASALAKTTSKSCADVLSSSSSAAIDAQHECRRLLQGYDLLGTILGGQGHGWMLPYLRILTFSSRPVDEVKHMARKISISGTERRRQLRELWRLSPDVSAKFVAPKAQQDNPFGKAIGNVMAYSIVGDLIDRSTDFDLNWVLLQISTTRMIAATSKAMMSFDVNVERRAIHCQPHLGALCFGLSLLGGSPALIISPYDVPDHATILDYPATSQDPIVGAIFSLTCTLGDSAPLLAIGVAGG